MLRFALLFVLTFLLFPILPTAQVEDPYPTITRHVKKSPESIHQDLPALTDYLISASNSEPERAWAIYSWISRNIQYDEEAYKNGERRINKNLADILERKQAVCFGYSLLFKAMCDEAELASEVIAGYSKGTLTSQPNLEKADHAWNAVQLDGNWALLDVTWGSSLLDSQNDFVQSFEEGYFLTTPQKFILNHLPLQPMWQLLDCPVGPEDFKKSAEQIISLIDNKEPCYNFEDSIRQFRSNLLPDKKLQEAIYAYQYNATSENKKELGHAYTDYAGRISDLADQALEQGELEQFMNLQKKALSAYEQAALLIELYDWQKELYADLLINQTVALYQLTDQVVDKQQVMDNHKMMLSHLEKAELALKAVPVSMTSEQRLEQCRQYREVVLESLEKR